MRKSLLGRRSSTQSCNDSSVAAKPEHKKSMLLQPGFSQTKRRASSEDRLSAFRGPSHVLQTARKSRCDMSLMENLPPCTPLYFRDKLALPSGSSRPSRSRTSSVESNRFSSIGSIKCSKKETRPINDKQFQSVSLKKVQEFFRKQPNCLQVLDNSYNVKPMTLKKFINMVDYLLKFVDERIIINKENYIEELVKAAKMLNYGGKIDRSWLVVVNTQHAWCHVIAFLVWLVDVVELQEQVKNAADWLYPEPIYEDECEDLIDANIRFIQPYLVEQFQARFTNNPPTPEEYERADNLLVEQLLQKKELTDEDFQVLLQEEMRVKAMLENPEYQAEEIKLQKQELELQTIKETYRNLKDYISQTEICLETRTEEVERLEKSNEALARSIKEKMLKRDKLRETVDELKLKVTDVNENKQQRLEYEREIHYNEKCMADLSKSLYQIEIANAKLTSQMEPPLIEYNNLIAIHTKNEPRLKNCHVDSVKLGTKAVSEAEKILTSLMSEWAKLCTNAKVLLQDLESKYSMLKEAECEVTNELQKREEKIRSVTQEKNSFVKQKQKEFNELQDSIKHYETETKKLMERIPEVSTKELDQLKQHYEAQVKEIQEVMVLSEQYFMHESQMRSDCLNNIEDHLINTFNEAHGKIRLNKEVNKK